MTKSKELPRGRWGNGGGPPLSSMPEPEDGVEVDRLLAGEVQYAARGAAVRRAAIALADVGGASAREVAIQVGCSTRTVHRHRVMRRLQGNTIGH